MSTFIFDLDGTLANSIPLIRKAAHLTGQEYGISTTDEEIDRFIGIPLIVTGETVLGPGRGQEYVDAYARNYHSLKDDISAFPGVKEMLAQLSEAGAKLAIATSKREKPAHETLRKIGIIDYFSVILNSESGCGYKPEAGPALKAMELLDSAPQQSWFIGDSPHDIACGHAAGIGSIGVYWGITAPGGFDTAPPEYCCHDVAELTQLLLRLHQEDQA